MSNNARKIRPKAYLARAIGLALGLLPVSLFGQVTGSWNVDASGNWTTTTNWNSDPNYPRDGGTAAFGMAASAPVTVTLDVDVTLAGLTFAGANQYTIAAMEPFQITLVGSHIVNVFNGVHEVSAPIAGTVGLIKNGAGSLILSGNSTFSGSIFINSTAGLLRASSSGALGTPTSGTSILLGSNTALELDAGVNGIDLGMRNVALASGASAESGGSLRVLSGSNLSAGDYFIMSPTVINVSDGATLTHSGEIIDNNVSGHNGLTKIGDGVFETKRFGGAPVAPMGAPQPVTSLTLADGLARVSTSADVVATTSRINTLTITDGSLDLTNNRVVIDYTGDSPLTTVISELHSTEIFTSTLNRRIGYAEASELFLELPPSWSGQPIDATSLLLQSTLSGDLNLDGAVNFQDLLLIAQHYGGPGQWLDGDVNYDGLVNFTDLLTVSQTYGMSIVGNGNTILGDDHFASDWASVTTSVPEPSTAWLLILAGLATRRAPVIR